MSKQDYILANKQWLIDKAKEDGVKALSKGIYYKELASGEPNGKHPSPRSIVTAPDFLQLAEIRIAFLKSDFENFDEIGEQKIRQSLQTYFEAHLNKDFFAFVAKDGEKIVASAFLVVIEKPANPNFPNGKIGEVLNVYTSPEFRKQGIATQLMKMLLAHAKKLCLDFVELKATSDGFPLYKNLGFCEKKSEYVGMKYVFVN